MTVSSIIPVNNYTGNSSTTRFDFDFLIEKASELVVKHFNTNNVETTLTYGVDYSINEIGNANGSYITFPLNGSEYEVLKTGEKISLMLDLVIKQENEFRNSLYYNIEVIEWTYDYIIRILQILSRKIDRCVKVQEGSGQTPDTFVNDMNITKAAAIAAAQQAATSEQSATEAKQTANDRLTSINSKYDQFLETYQSCITNINNTGINTRSTVNLDNLSTNGEKHFLNKTQITNCIIEAPNGVLEYSGSTLTAKAGLKVLIPNGKNADGTYKNTEYTLENDVSTSVSFNNDKRSIILDNGSLSVVTEIFVGDAVIVNTSHTERWYNTLNNKMYYHTSGSSEWIEAPNLVIIGEIYTSSSDIVSLNPYKPLMLAQEQNIDGKWIVKTSSVASNVSLNNSSGTSIDYSLSSYLPNDGNIYEVMLRAIVTTGTTSGHIVSVQLSSTVMDDYIIIGRARTRASSSVDSGGTGILLVGPDRKITLSRSSSWNGTLNSLHTLAYRKVR